MGYRLFQFSESSPGGYGEVSVGDLCETHTELVMSQKIPNGGDIF